MNDGPHGKTISNEELISDSWFPKKIYKYDNRWHIDWKCMDDKRFTEPFYQDTIARITSEPRRKFTSSITVLESSQNSSFQTAGPSAFIFHVSRCGSTLLTQMLSQIPENIVISEAPVIDQLIRSELPQKRKMLYLNQLIQLLCRKRFPEEEYAFIKFDAWHLFSFDEIRNLFPDVPVLILYRNPEDVLLSHAKIRGQHMVPGFFSDRLIPLNEEDYANPDRYAGKVLQLYFETILQICHRLKVILLNYNELTGDIWSLLDRQMQVSWSPKKIEKMKSRAQYYSKDKNLVFSTDDHHKAGYLPSKNMDALNLYYKKLEGYRKKYRDQ